MPVNLMAGDTISLTDPAPRLLGVGIGWTPGQPPGAVAQLLGAELNPVDLDISCYIFDAEGQRIDQVWARKPNSLDGKAVMLGGDHRTGSAAGVDEVIFIQPALLPAQAHSLVFGLTCGSDHDFGVIKGMHARVFDIDSNHEYLAYEIISGGSYRSHLICRLARAPGGWQLQALRSDGRAADPIALADDAAAQAGGYAR